MQRTQTIAIIGGGPRGLAVAERLGMALARRPGPGSVRVLLIDDHEPGAGRIWRRSQDASFLMNTVAEQVTMYSGPRDGGADRPGHGPTLYEWLRESRITAAIQGTDNTFATRQQYGQYLCSVLQALRSGYPAPHRLIPVHGLVCDLLPLEGGRHLLAFADDRPAVMADAIVIATGHARSAPDPRYAEWEDFCRGETGCSFRGGDSAADLDLQDVEDGESVGVIGMGLGFHDVVAALSTGRGGHYETVDGELQYRASGREPRIFAGSRSGLPIPARGRNQKVEGRQKRFVFFNADALETERALQQASRQDAALSFHRHVLPLLLAELDHVHYTTWVRRRHGEVAAQGFAQAHACERDPHRALSPSWLARHGLGDVPPLDLAWLGRPFGATVYAHPDDFRSAWRAHLSRDLDEARLGNLDSPLKAALDVLRDVRDTLRSNVEFDALNETSLRAEFLEEFSPLCGLLAAGPPTLRIEQLLALEACGVLSIVGPGMSVELDRAEGRFVLHSPQVPGALHAVTRLIDSRVPFPGLVQSRNPLLKSLFRRGLVRPYRHPDGLDLCSGGIEVIPQSLEVMQASGVVHACLFAIGLPTERPRWFTQVGSATPGTRSRFTLDAEAVAEGLLACLTQEHPAVESSELSEVAP